MSWDFGTTNDTNEAVPPPGAKAPAWGRRAGAQQRLKGRSGWRLRIGEWRVIFDTTPGGEEMVVLSRQDFERLVAASEDLADITAYDEAKARLASGDDELVPAVVVDAMLGGGNPIRVWRRYRGLALGELATTTALSNAYLSQIETGKRQGQADTRKRIASALGVTVDDLI